ncbi:ATP-dependent zinc metalloprotease FtsH [candidate division WS5 bacterium]|uniref:ATP-dependent zinc metalloprotease FtsH n=1 Tax=candidate division WS5 bacterium TaxID=2093353 RepID=A0A419DGU2_9BACT|nr:MAG: ATP-dependent zinc metalloprotease FtsH [candidate division WS5 bacterium]
MLKKSKGNKSIFIFIAIILVLAAIYSFYIPSQTQEKVDISRVAQEVKDNQVKNIKQEGSKITVTLNDDKKQISSINENEKITDVLKFLGVEQVDPTKVSIESKSSGSSSFWVMLLIQLLPVILIVGILYFFIRQSQGASNQALGFGKSKPQVYDKTKKKVTFKEVAGSEEAKEELEEIVEFLKYPKKFLNLGAKIPKGVLLFGQPGTGKTLLARAVAGEADVPFFSISGSEFVEMFVGVGASRVRDLFNKAKKNAPCIIFIDEIDAVGRQRGSGLGGSHDEREQTLNQILVEMDGFEKGTNVIVMAATNRPDVLDPALLRPGRFDRRIVLDMPDVKDREAILKVHAEGKPLSKEVKLETIAKQTPGFSGADLENLMNEAAILTARKNRKEITMADLSAATEKVLLGPERKSNVLNKKEKEITAYHEAGHAIIGHLLPNTDPIHKISIVSRGMALGVTWSLPKEDLKLLSKSKIIDEITMAMGGRAAEELVFNEKTTGASNDIEKATKMARNTVVRFGMNDRLGPQLYGHREEQVFLGRELTEHDKNYSEKTAGIIDEETNKLIMNCYNEAIEILKKNRSKLNLIAKRLIEKETIEGEDFEQLMSKIDKK